MALSALQILALKSFKGVGNKTIFKIADSCRGFPKNEELPEILEFCVVKKKNNNGVKTPYTQDDINAALSNAQKVIDRAAAIGAGVLSYYDEAFPQILKETKSEDGKKDDPPVLLFYRGDLSVLNMPCIAVIGTRENTQKGEKAARYLAESFASRGFAIVSGLALGCDTFGHEGALAAESGRTIAFLGNGVDTSSIYPEQNRELAEKIVERGGLLLSEYAVGEKVNRFSLVARDRLQAGLALATIVIQTGIKGGTMHAAMATINSGKPLFVAKYSDEETDQHPQTEGNHFLKEKHGARYIGGAKSLMDLNVQIDSIAQELRKLHASNRQGAADYEEQLDI